MKRDSSRYNEYDRHVWLSEFEEPTDALSFDDSHES
jgi:hypothetical protein